MRILYVSEYAGVHDRRWLAALSGWGYDCHFLSLAEKPGIPLPPGAGWIQWEGNGLLWDDPAGYGALAESYGRIFDELAPDVVLAGPLDSAAQIACEKETAPVVGLSWGYDLLVVPQESPEGRAAVTRALRSAAGLVCDSRTTLSLARELSGRPDLPVVRFPWGTEPDRFTPDGECYPLPDRWAAEGVIVVLSTRKWEPLYATDVLVEGFAEAHLANPELRLILLGDGSLRDRIDSIVRTRGIEDAVWAPGTLPHTDLPLLYRSADLYVSTALQDGTSVSLLEAMASGAVPIVTDNASNREWVDDGSTGFLAAPRDAADLTRVLRRVADLNPAERDAVRRAARARVQEHARWDENVLRLKTMLVSLVNASTGASAPHPLNRE